MPHKPLSGKIDHSHTDQAHSHEHNHEQVCNDQFEKYVQILKKPEIKRT